MEDKLCLLTKVTLSLLQHLGNGRTGPVKRRVPSLPENARVAYLALDHLNLLTLMHHLLTCKRSVLLGLRFRFNEFETLSAVMR